MSVSHDAIRSAIAEFVSGEQIAGLKETNGKVLLTLAVDVPMGEKPAFAERIKQRMRAIAGIKDVFIFGGNIPRPADIL